MSFLNEERTSSTLVQRSMSLSGNVGPPREVVISHRGRVARTIAHAVVARSVSKNERLESASPSLLPLVDRVMIGASDPDGACSGSDVAQNDMSLT